MRFLGITFHPSAFMNLFPGGVKFNTVSFALLVLMAALYAYGAVTGSQNTIIENYGIYIHSSIYTWITHAFIHGGLLHIVMNGFVLLQTGHIIEKQMGVMKFIIFTMLCAVFAGLGGSWLSHALGKPDTLLIGFSGVIFGYFGVLAQMVVSHARDKKKAIWEIVIQNPMLVAFIVLPFIFPVGISGEGHLLGLVFGIVTAKYFRNRRKS